MPKLYGYYIVRDYMYESMLGPQDLAFGTCAFEVMLKELERGNIIVHIQLRDHD